MDGVRRWPGAQRCPGEGRCKTCGCNAVHWTAAGQQVCSSADCPVDCENYDPEIAAPGQPAAAAPARGWEHCGRKSVRRADGLLVCVVCGGWSRIGETVQPAPAPPPAPVEPAGARVMAWAAAAIRDEPGGIDTANRYLVASLEIGVLMMHPPHEPMSPDQALTLAAWLVAVVGDRRRFEAILRAVEGT